MFFQGIVASAFLAFASANVVIDQFSGEIPATSDLGSKLLASARVLSNDNEEMSWVTDYSIKFLTCRHQVGYGNNADGGDDNGGNGAGGMSVTRLAEFRLCPSGSGCSATCNYGATYVVDLGMFVATYQYSLKQIEEKNCELINDNCENYVCNGDDNDDGCIQSCITNTGHTECLEAEEGGDEEEEMDWEEGMACVQDERGEDGNDDGNNNNNRNWYNWWSGYNSYTCYNEDCALYTGPYCSTSGKTVYMGTFIDATCSVAAPKGTYESYHYGQSQRFSSSSLVSSQCLACDITEGTLNRRLDEEEEVEVEILEMCGGLYEESLRCEENMTVSYPDDSACDYIKDYLPYMDTLYRAKNSYRKTSHNYAYAFGGFALIGLAAFGGTKYMTAKRSSVQLSEQDYAGGVMS